METVFADKVVSTIPPNLTDKTVVFEPNLPEDIVQEAKKRTLGWANRSSLL
jgi:hypothetical protein